MDTNTLSNQVESLGGPLPLVGACGAASRGGNE